MVLYIQAQAQTTGAPIPKACPYDCCRPDGHAPLGIMTDHIHLKNQWALSYTYMNSSFLGMRNGSTLADDNTTFMDYAMSARRMNMDMHMFSLMYGLSSRLTLMGMVDYMSQNMTMDMNMESMHMHGSGSEATDMQMSASGFSDTRIYALYSLLDRCSHRLILHAALTLPTGSINRMGNTLLSDSGELSYGMQTGSGSWALEPGLTYEAQRKHFSWGGVASALCRLNTNTAGYRDGNIYSASAWLSWKWFHLLSSSLRVEATNTAAITGFDSRIQLLSANDPMADARNSGNTRALCWLGTNFYKDRNPGRNLRLGIEYGIPFYERTTGLQPSLKGELLAGIQYLFN